MPNRFGLSRPTRLEGITSLRRRASSSGGSTETPGVFRAYDFTSTLPSDILAAWSGPTSGNSFFEEYKALNKGTGIYAGTANKLIRQDSAGLRMEPGVTNEATNPRSEGAVAATLNAISADVACTVTAVNGSHVFTVNATAHGRSDFDRVQFPVAISVGGITIPVSLNPTGSVAYQYTDYTIFNVTANTFDIYFYKKATTGNTSSATNFRYRTWATTGSLPTGQQILTGGASTRLVRIQRVVAPSGTYLSNSQQQYNIAGTGTKYIALKNIPCGQGQDLAFSAFGTLLAARTSPSANDNWSVDNLGLEVAFVERDATGMDTGNVLRETTVDLMANMTSSNSSYCRMVGATTTQHASCASVDVCLKISGATGCDHNLELREYQITKTKQFASMVLPTVGSLTSVSRSDETCTDISAAKTIRGADYTFSCKEIVNSTDTIISFGNVELQATGTTWPRNLRLTDGTNTITLAGALRDLWPTQQTVRASMSFGPSGLALSVADDFVTTVSSASTPAYAGGSPNTFRLNESGAGTRRGMTIAKALKLYNAQRNAAACTAAARLTADLVWTGGVPGVDLAIGRTSLNTLKTYPSGGIPTSGTFGTNNGLSIGSGRIQVNANAANQVFEDFDFRGGTVYFDNNTGSVVNVTFRNCLFDQSTAGRTNSFVQPLTTCTGWTIENCTFEINNTSGVAYSAFIRLLGTGHIIRKCIFKGSTADILNFFSGLTLEDCILIQTPDITPGAHPDAMQVNSVTDQALLVQRCLIDFRKVYGTRIEPNTAMSANAGNTVGNILFPLTYKDILAFGGINQVDANAAAPGTSLTLPGLFYGDASVTFTNVQLAMSPINAVDFSFNQKQLKFVGGSITCANAGGRTYNQNFLGLFAGTYPSGWRAGGVRGPSKAAISLATSIGSLENPMVATDAFSIDVNSSGSPQTITVVAAGTASGNNQINVSGTGSTVQDLINKIQALWPALTVTLEDFQASKDIKDYWSGASL